MYHIADQCDMCASMRNLVKPEPLSQNGLFDTEKFGW